MNLIIEKLFPEKYQDVFRISNPFVITCMKSGDLLETAVIQRLCVEPMVFTKSIQGPDKRENKIKVLASLDGHKNEKIYEVKLLSKELLSSIKKTRLCPPHVYAQIQMQLFVADSDCCEFYYGSYADVRSTIGPHGVDGIDNIIKNNMILVRRNNSVISSIVAGIVTLDSIIKNIISKPLLTFDSLCETVRESFTQVSQEAFNNCESWIYDYRNETFFRK